MLFLNESKSNGGGGLAVNLDEMLKDPIFKEMTDISEEMGIREEDYDVFGEGAEGILEVALEMETAWGAIINDAASLEHQAIVNEDQSILDEGVKEVFKSIGDFFMKIWNAISGWFKKTVAKLFSKFGNQEKWWNGVRGDVTVKSIKMNGNANVADGNNVANELIAAVKSIDTIGAPDAESQTAGQIKAKILGAEGEQEFTDQGVSIVLSGSTKYLAHVKNIVASAGTDAKNGQRLAKAGASSAAKGGDDAAKAKTEIEGLKKSLAGKQRVAGAVVSAYSTAISQASTAGRMLLSASKKGAKDDK